MSRYRTNPETVEAVQWKGTNLDEVLDLIYEAGRPAGQVYYNHGTGQITAEELEEALNEGQFLIKNKAGQLYTLSESAFYAKHALELE